VACIRREGLGKDDDKLRQDHQFLGKASSGLVLVVVLMSPSSLRAASCGHEGRSSFSRASRLQVVDMLRSTRVSMLERALAK
jgi:hypothetical protein